MCEARRTLDEADANGSNVLVQPFNPIQQTPITDPIGYAQRIQHQNEQAAAAAMAGGLIQPATVSGQPSAEAEERRRRQQVEQDPASIDRLVAGAIDLIERFPNEAVPVVVSVEIPSRIPGRRPASGEAEVARAWPIGTFERLYKDSVMRSPFAVAADGTIFRLDSVGSKATVELTPAMRWSKPQAQRPWGRWVAAALATVESDLAAREGRVGGAVTSPTDLRGPVSGAARKKAGELRRKQNDLIRHNRKLFELYGTRTNSRIQGPPTRAMKRAWAQAEAAEAKVQRMNRQIAELGVEMVPFTVLPTGMTL